MTYYCATPAASSALFAPAVNLYENDQEVRLVADLAGYKKEDIRVEVKDGRLELAAKAAGSEHPEGYKVLHSERRHGDLARSFRLGDGLDAEKIDASLEAGVLTVTIAKREEAKPRTIEIK